MKMSKPPDRLTPALDANRLAAIRAAKEYLTAAIAASGQLAVGTGHGPVHHFHNLWKP